MAGPAAPLTPAVVAEHGLSPDEFERIKAILGREPSLLELGIYSALWSEHCSYKSSRPFLKEFPTTGPRVLQGPGENAGAVDIGDGLAVVFKMESHNHPSFIEPYQGAATGVGGILRDVFTMGARPVAILDPLFFGDPAAPRMRDLVDGVVRGIGGYGNCIGVPTVGGMTFFHPAYNRNILVNAMAVGLVRQDRIFRAKASGRRQPRPVRRLEDGPGRHPRRLDGLRRLRRREVPEAADGSGRRPVRREAPPRGGPRGARRRRGRRDPGHGRRGPHVLDVRDVLARRRRDAPRPLEGPDARDGDDALRAHAVRVPGADGPRREEGSRERGRCRVPPVGRRRRDDRRRHGRAADDAPLEGGGRRGPRDRAARRGRARPPAARTRSRSRSRRPRRSPSTARRRTRPRSFRFSPRRTSAASAGSGSSTT